MVLTLELPIRPATTNLFTTYQQRFGALPSWLDELHTNDARALLRLALRRGAPLASADQPY